MPCRGRENEERWWQQHREITSEIRKGPWITRRSPVGSILSQPLSCIAGWIGGCLARSALFGWVSTSTKFLIDRLRAFSTSSRAECCHLQFPPLVGPLSFSPLSLSVSHYCVEVAKLLVELCSIIQTGTERAEAAPLPTHLVYSSSVESRRTCWPATKDMDTPEFISEWEFENTRKKDVYFMLRFNICAG